LDGIYEAGLDSIRTQAQQRFTPVASNRAGADSLLPFHSSN
jgi:hypothetical protein